MQQAALFIVCAKTLKQSTVKELTLTNELLSDRMERDLRYLQETMSVAFRGFNQSYSRGQRNSVHMNSLHHSSKGGLKGQKLTQKITIQLQMMLQGRW